jgi:hypothetical protein
MLALVGTCPRPMLNHFAEDETFTGTVICGLTPPLFFMPDQAPMVEEARAYLRHYDNRSISGITDFYLSIPINSAFASLNKEDLSLAQLIQQLLRFPNREGAMILPEFPPYFGGITGDRRYHMWSRMENDPAFQHRVQQIWLPLLKLAPPFGGDGLTALMQSVGEDVEKIESRGGKVIFLRCPSTDEFRRIESELWPREQYWDKFFELTGAKGIHFEDYPELNQFDCPEWSHLTRSDAVTFTRNLLPIIQGKLSE